MNSFVTQKWHKQERIMQLIGKIVATFSCSSVYGSILRNTYDYIETRVDNERI